MKYLETKFIDYLSENKRVNIHNELKDVNDLINKDKYNNNDLILYGPPGVGKYTQALNIIKNHSSSGLNYERKININIKNKNKNNTNYNFKISDIHFEIDMELLGCNSKLLWNEIYYHILDIISTRPNKKGIILCKNFHKIHQELLENFYSYMQLLNYKNIQINYIILTEHIGFIPTNIKKRSILIPIKRPTKNNYIKCVKKTIVKNYKLKTITNIKNIKTNINIFDNIYKNKTSKIVNILIDYKNINFLKLRDFIYDIFIYQLDIYTFIHNVIALLIEKGKIKEDSLKSILLNIYIFFKKYNNNYRPIYHVEMILLYICKTINNL